jgi:imidazole glycerol-phosphate synthase subunit HisH
VTSPDSRLQIALIDYGIGNVGSVGNALDTLKVPYKRVSSAAGLEGIHGIILPGVGAFAAGMENLKARGLDGPLTDLVKRRKLPFLGICLGMQMLAIDSTEHGLHQGLGWLNGHVRELSAAGMRVPHIGWNPTKASAQSGMFSGIAADAPFYYDHGYALACAENLVVARCDYGGEVVAAIADGNIWATQFHPEKSQRDGLKLLRNFANAVWKAQRTDRYRLANA